jgi:segregation and condensation protein A
VSSSLNFHLELYEGPLDLLLDLIRKQQIDIRDIPIASITAQYFEYMEKAREMDIDPRQELVDRLLEHEKFKNAAEMLQQKRLIEDNVWSNPQVKAFISEDDDPGLSATLFDLVKAFGEVLERTKNRPIYEVAGEDVSVADMILYLKSIFLAQGEDEPIFIVRVFEQQRTRRAMIALFLAVLEMVKLQAVEVCQQDLFGEIALRRQKSFDAVFAAGDPVSAIEKDYK